MAKKVTNFAQAVILPFGIEAIVFGLGRLVDAPQHYSLTGLLCIGLDGKICGREQPAPFKEPWAWTMGVFGKNKHAMHHYTGSILSVLVGILRLWAKHTRDQRLFHLAATLQSQYAQFMLYRWNCISEMGFVGITLVLSFLASGICEGWGRNVQTSCGLVEPVSKAPQVEAIPNGDLPMVHDTGETEDELGRKVYPPSFTREQDYELLTFLEGQPFGNDRKVRVMATHSGDNVDEYDSMEEYDSTDEDEDDTDSVVFQTGNDFRFRTLDSAMIKKYNISLSG